MIITLFCLYCFAIVDLTNIFSHTPQKPFPASHVHIPEVISFIPFQHTLYLLIIPVPAIHFSNILPDLPHYSIPGFLFTVSQTEIYLFRSDLFCFRIFQPSGEPYGWRYSGCCRKFDSTLFLVSAPQGKQSCKGITSQNYWNVFYIFL